MTPDNVAQGAVLSPDQWDAQERASIERLEQMFFPPRTRMIEGRRGLVTTTSSSIALHAGLRTLKAGGTAADAAVAVALTQPTTALGSYVSYAGVMQALYYEARTGEVHSLDAGWNSYLHETDAASIPPCDSGSTDRGARPSEMAHGRKTLVAGFMAGAEAFHRRFGQLSFSGLLQPAIWYAENGVTISPDLASFFRQREGDLSRTPEGRQFLNQADNDLPQVGDRFVQAELAKTLRAVASEGAQYMYVGDWGRQFVEIVRREGGKATLADMARYEAHWEEPQCTTFVDRRVFAPGGENNVRVLQALNLIEELGIHRMGPYWQDEHAFSQLARILAFVCDDDTETLEARVSKGRAHAVASVLAELHGGKRSKPMRGHSDAIVAIDHDGNVATVVHTINTVLWGDTGIVVGGVPISDAGGFGPEQFASKEPGDRISDGMQSSIAMADGKPILATAAVGCSGVAETVRMLLGILGNQLDAQVVRAAPPLLFDWGEFSSDAPSGRTDRLIPDGMYAPEFLRRVEQVCGTLRRIPYRQTEGIRGTVVLSAIDPTTEIRRAFETSDVFGLAAAC